MIRESNLNDLYRVCLEVSSEGQAQALPLLFGDRSLSAISMQSTYVNQAQDRSTRFPTSTMWKDSRSELHHLVVLIVSDLYIDVHLQDNSMSAA